MDNSGFIERANLLLSQGRPKDAETFAKKALETDPDDDAALSILARCYMDQHNYDEAIQLLQKAIAKEPGESLYFYLLGFCYYHENDASLAERYVREAIQMNPYNPGYFGLMAYIYIGERRFEEALEKANEGLALDAEDITCLNARSTAQNKLKMTDDAIATMQDALAKDPDNEFTHSVVGWNLLEKGKHNEARTHFREALRIDPGMSSAQEGLKEALKSKIPPYRWLLQFGFWLQNKGKNFTWIFLIGLYVIVRVVVSISMKNKATENFGVVLAGAYALFAGMSWFLHPMANAFLLFHKDGKHALSAGEKWNARAFLSCILIGIAIMGSSAFFPEAQQHKDILTTGIIWLSLCIPAGHLRVPLRLRSVSWGDWIALAMGAIAVLSLASAFAGFQATEILGIVYFIMFIAYTWVKSFAK